MQIKLLRNADRILNYLFGFCLVLLFVLDANSDEHIRMLIALGLSLIIAIVSFILNWLTLDGMRSAVLFGTAVLGVGGWMPALAVLLFFLSSSVISRQRGDQTEISEALLSSRTKFRRNGWQVWASGFWVVFMLILFFLFHNIFLVIAAYGAVAAATSDTWATEIGCRNPGKTVLITTFEKTAPGTDGGISLKGSLAAITGSLFIAGAMYLVSPQVDKVLALVIVISGLAGCVVDSYLGAIYQSDTNSNSNDENGEVFSDDYLNSIINWVATGSGALISMIITEVIT